MPGLSSIFGPRKEILDTEQNGKGKRVGGGEKGFVEMITKKTTTWAYMLYFAMCEATRV